MDDESTEIESQLREIIKRKSNQELAKIIAFHQSHIDLVYEEMGRRDANGSNPK